jgi:hypothetical protein
MLPWAVGDAALIGRHLASMSPTTLPAVTRALGKAMNAARDANNGVLPLDKRDSGALSEAE